MMNWINLFLFICSENNADIKDKRTKVGDDNKNIIKILKENKNSIPNRSELSGIKKKFENKTDKNIDKLLAINICSAE